MSSTLTETASAAESSPVISTEGNIASFSDGLVYEVVKLAECEYDPDSETFYYLCPCGDVFELMLDDLVKGNLVSECPSCSLRIRIELAPGDLDEFVAARGRN